MENLEIEKLENLSRYLIGINKSLQKSLDYTLGIIGWYVMTDEQTQFVENFIKNNW